jgi:hypothetical protein
MRMTRFVALLPLLFPSPTMAAPVFSYGQWYIGDGGNYDAGAYPGGVFGVQNGTLNIGPGATVLSASESGSGASIVMSGGQVQAGISVNSGNLTVTGGQSRGYDNSAYGGDGVFVSSSAQISGGTFTGGNSPGQAGSGVVASAGTVDGRPTLSTVDISGGTFVGGTGSGGYYGGTSGYSLASLGDTTVTGGHFLSPIVINAAYGGVTDFLGSHLTYQNGILSGLLKDGDPIHVQVFAAGATAAVNDSGTEVRFASGPSSSPTPTPDPAPIPEPTTAMLFGLAVALALGRRLTRRSH